MLKGKIVLKFGALLGFWYLLSGSMDWQHTLVGAIASAIILRFWQKPSEEGRLRPGPFFYGILLAAVMLTDIWKSAWHVALIILSRKRVQPEFVWINTPLRTPLARVILANCITLTPGTLTVALEKNRMLVHALTHDHALALADWRVHRILQKMEGKHD